LIKTGKGQRGEGARRWVIRRSSIGAVAGGIGEEEEATTVWKPRVMEGEGKQEAGEGVEERTQIDDGVEVVEQASA
jgi:hypothetical protein